MLSRRLPNGHRRGSVLVAAALLAVLAINTGAAQETLTVVVDGVTGAIGDNVDAFLQIQRVAESREPPPGEARIRWLHQAALQDIQNALQPFGYYRPRIDSRLTRTRNGWQAEYRIEPGPPIPIAKLDVRVLGAGADDPAFRKLLADLPLAVGHRLQHQRYEKIKQDLQNIATERGYFDARLSENQIQIDLAHYRANVALHLDTGARYRYGPIRFEQKTLAPEFLQRYLDIKTGDPYAAADLLKLQSSLIASDYFDEVVLDASPDRAEKGSVPVDIKLSARNQRKYSGGLGYGTDTGVRGRLRLEQRWVNRWGHRYEAEVLASQRRYGVAGQYTIPGQNPRSDSLNLRSSLSAEKSTVVDSQTATLGAVLQREREPWQSRLSLDYQWEAFKFSGERRTTSLLIGGAGWTWVQADDRTHTTNGTRLGIELRGAGAFLLSDISFAQAALRAKWIKTLNPKNRLIMRGDAGSTLIKDSDFDQLPATLRFFAGGDNSVRGYALNVIGPRDADGDVIGGKRLLVGSVEFEHEIRENWSIAAFVDSGDAFNDAAPEFRTGLGLGVRWRSPVGPLRMDFAHGLERPGDAFRLHLSIGPDL
ncbi:MAG: autotransporter assembly complex family protein [Gammaproteobacteria bacterium]